MQPDEIERRFMELERRIDFAAGRIPGTAIGQAARPMPDRTQKAPVLPPIDPISIMAAARERVLAHGGSFADAVQDLLDARKLLSAALSLDCGRSEK